MHALPFPLTVGFARPGNIVLFCLPSSSQSVDVGMVLSVWRGVKASKLVSSGCPIDNCSAFRVVTLDKRSADDPESDYYCNSTSPAWALRVESLVTILDCERCALDSFHSFPMLFWS